MKRLTLLLAILISTISIAQTNPQMQLNCDITINGKKIPKNDYVLVTIIDNTLNSKVIQVPNKLLYNLEYNREYTILFEYEGCQAKSIYFNNYTPATDTVLTCYFNINLVTNNKDDILQVAEVYYDKEHKDFTYRLVENFNN